MSLKRERVKKKKRKYLRSLYYDFIRLFGGGVAAICMRPKVHYISKKAPKRMNGGVLIAANHTSFSDAIILFVVFWYRHLSFVATKDIFNNGFSRFFLNNMHCIPIDREKFSTKALRTICDRLNGEHAVLIFPEGKINQGESDLLEFKDGLAYIALKCNKPVLPVYIAVRDSMKKRHNVVVGEPVYVNELYINAPRSERIRLISEHLRRCELELKEYYDTKVGKGREAKKQNTAPDIQYS